MSDDPTVRDAVIKMTVVVERLVTDVRDLGAKTDAASSLKADVAALKGDVALLKRIVYGCVGVVLVAVLGAVITLVVKK